MISVNQLPRFWRLFKLKDVCKIVGGGTPSTKNKNYFNGKISWITPADLSNYTQKYISHGKRFLSEEGINNSSAKILPKGSVLFSSRAPIGYVVIAKKELCTNQGFRSLIPSEIVYNEYLYYYLKSSKKLAEQYASGTTFKEISGTKLGELPFPLPPLDIQYQIVKKIEQLLSELDNGIENLKKAKQQLETYKQAVLKAAFEGKLTKEWREQQDDLPSAEELKKQIQQERKRYYEKQLEDWKREVKKWEEDRKKGKKPRKPKKFKEIPPIKKELDELHSLPFNWQWIRLNGITPKVEYGTSKKSHESGDVPVLRMGNMQDGQILWNDLVYTSDKEKIEKYELKKGDVLFNRTNSPELVGKTSIYQGEQKAIFAGYLIRINQFRSIVDSRYLNYYMNSITAKNYGNEVKTDAVNQSNINGTKLSSYPFPFTSFKEQNIISDEIDDKFSIVNSVIQTINDELLKANALRQSILKKAFEGKLINEKVLD